MTSEDFNIFSLLQFNCSSLTVYLKNTADFSSNEVSHKVFQKLSMKIHPHRKKKKSVCKAFLWTCRILKQKNHLLFHISLPGLKK